MSSLSSLSSLRSEVMPLLRTGPLARILQRRSLKEARLGHKRTWGTSGGKRVVDIVVSSLVLLTMGIPMILIGIAVVLSSPGPALFRQKRIGRDGRRFTIYKFRSMLEYSPHKERSGLTRGGDSRVTMLGRWLRQVKLDELPQFYNVLRGDMSLVGPRPKLAEYAVQADIAFRPGITGAATLAFRNEEELLRHVPSSQIEEFYHDHIRPLKSQIDHDYMDGSTFWTDMWLLLATALGISVFHHYSQTYPSLRDMLTLFEEL